MNNQSINQQTHFKEVLLALAYLGEFELQNPEKQKEFTNELAAAMPEHKSFFLENQVPYKYAKNFLRKTAGLCIIYDQLEILNKHCTYSLLTSFEPGADFVLADYCTKESNVLDVIESFNLDPTFEEMLFKIAIEQSEKLPGVDVSIKESIIEKDFPSESVCLGFLRPTSNEKQLIEAIVANESINLGGHLVVIVNKSAVKEISLELSSHFKIATVSKCFNPEQTMIICEKAQRFVPSPNAESALIESVNKNTSLSMKASKKRFTLVNFEARQYELYCVKNSEKFVSDTSDKAWKSFKELTTIGTNTNSKLVMPKAPKQGELSLVIAAGYINGEMSLGNGEGKHVVIGGVEHLKGAEDTISFSKSGHAFESTVVTKSSKPFLNILINNKGKLMIKQLND